MNSKFALPLLLAACLPLSSCVTEDYGPATYSSSMRGQAMQVYIVEIVSIRPVRIKDSNNLVGMGAGALAGGIAGSMIGHGKASTLAAVGGAVAGGMLGNEVGKSATQSRGLEIQVRTASGQEWVVIQENHGEGFMIGERVRMMVGEGKRYIAR